MHEEYAFLEDPNDNCRNHTPKPWISCQVALPRKKATPSCNCASTPASAFCYRSLPSLPTPPGVLASALDALPWRRRAAGSSPPEHLCKPGKDEAKAGMATPNALQMTSIAVHRSCPASGRMVRARAMKRAPRSDWTFVLCFRAGRCRGKNALQPKWLHDHPVSESYGGEETASRADPAALGSRTPRRASPPTERKRAPFSGRVSVWTQAAGFLEIYLTYPRSLQ